jgi:hypothetical protein
MWSRHNASVDGIRLGIVAFWCHCARSVSVILTVTVVPSMPPRYEPHTQEDDSALDDDEILHNNAARAGVIPRPTVYYRDHLTRVTRQVQTTKKTRS